MPALSDGSLLDVTGNGSRSKGRGDPILTVEGVTKVFPVRAGSVHALGPVDLALAPGEIVALLGPSGCGKSTLLNIIAGLLPPSEGTVRINGAEHVGVPLEVGMMFQKAVMLPWRTVLQNVLLPMEIEWGVRQSKRYTEKAMDLLALVGVADFAERYPQELSGGMQQRVAVCRMLIAEPSIFLLDEPFGSLDEITREHMNVELARICNLLDTATVFVTHGLQEAVFLADRVVVMTSRPGRFDATLEVTIPRDARTLDVLSTPEFQEHVGHARQLLHDSSKNVSTEE